MSSGPDTLPLEKSIPNIPNKRMVLEEQRRAFDSIGAGSSILDGKLQALLGSASLIISLLGTIQIAVLRQTGGWAFWLGLVVIISLYVWMVNIIVRGLKPLQYLTPVSDDWNQLTEQFFEVDENEGLNQQISNYLEYTEQNRALNFKKIQAVHRATRLFMVILVALLISMAISLYGQGNTISQVTATPTSEVILPTPVK
jgi:hypothetical protein